MSVATFEQELEALIKELEVKGEAAVAELYQKGLELEAKVKTEIVLLRERAANLGSEAGVEAEKLVIEAKGLLDKVLGWIKVVEGKLAKLGQVQDFNTGAQFTDER